MEVDLGIDMRHALEVILFSVTEPISSYQIARLLEEGGWVPDNGNLTPGQVERYIEYLVHEWEDEGRPLTVLRIAGGFQMATRPEWSELITKLREDRRSHRLSRAALETLAIVAYRQPVIRPDIDAIRGVNSDSALKTLLERGLVTISGRDEGPGRPLLYKTTLQFLKYFGLNNLQDLPDPSELATILGVALQERIDQQDDSFTEEKIIQMEIPEPVTGTEDLFGEGDIPSDEASQATEQ